MSYDPTISAIETLLQTITNISWLNKLVLHILFIYYIHNIYHINEAMVMKNARIIGALLLLNHRSLL